MGLLFLAASPISSSLFQSLLPETNPTLLLIKVKIPQLLYKNAMGRAQSNPAAGDNLSSPSLLLPPCVFPAFICLSHPDLLPSCYLLTRSSLHLPVALFSGLPLLPILLCVCVLLPALQKYSVRSENHNYHSCQMLSSSPPSTFSCKISRHSVMLHSPPTPSLPSITSPLSLLCPSWLC